MNNKVVNRLVPLPFILAGIVFAVVGIFVYNNNKIFMESAKETTAVIKEINNDDDDYTVVVYFNIDGTIYEGVLNEYNISMKTGGKVQIFYNVSNPSNFRSATSNNLAYIFIGLGLLVAFFGMIFLIKTNIKYRKYLNVKNFGLRIDAKIVSIDMDNTTSINGKNPYYVTCMALNPISRNQEYFRSENCWNDIRKKIEDNNLESLAVYIDPANATNYYVDISSIK